MTLIVTELYPGVIFNQNFRISKSLSVAHIRPWIYKHGSPQGEIVLQVYEGMQLLRESRLSCEYINIEIPETYAHGQLRFDVMPLQLNHDTLNPSTEYTLKIFVDGATKDPNNFIGLVKRYENPFYEVYGSINDDGESLNDVIEPLGFEIYNYTY